MDASNISSRSSTSSLDDHLSSIVHSRNLASVKKTIAVRWTPSSLNEMLGDSVNFTDECYWSTMTHFVFHGLGFAHDGTVSLPIEDPDSEKFPALDAETYIPILNELRSKWKNLKFVWSVPMLIDNMYVNAQLKKNPLLFINSLTDLVEKFSIDVIELDLGVLKYLKHIEDLRLVNCKFWFTYQPTSGQFENMDAIHEALNYLEKVNILDAVVLKSYGHLRVCRTPTSHGTYQSMFVYPEASLTDFVTIFNWMRISVPAHRILLDMDTSGVEYVGSKLKPGFVDRFRLQPNSVIRHRKMFGKSNFEEKYNAENGFSIIEFPAENTVISYDNAQVQRQKTEYVLENGLKGVVIGELSNDLHPLHPESLIAKTKNLFISTLAGQ